MDAEPQAHASTEVPAHPAATHGEPDLLDPSGQLVFWTWVTFFLVCVVLHKIAWKPILKALDDREANIRKSLEDAEAVRQEKEGIDRHRRQVLEAAEAQAKDLISGGRRGAEEAARVIEQKAREEAKIALENAAREIKAAQEKARATFRREGAEMAVSLAEGILKEKLNAESDRALVDRLLQEI